MGNLVLTPTLPGLSLSLGGGGASIATPANPLSLAMLPVFKGEQGAAGSEVVISATDPQLGTPPKAGPFLWVQPDETGALNDIYWVPA